MNKCQTRCPEEPDRELENHLECMRTRICELEKKFNSYDTVMAEKEELREQMIDVGKWVDQVTKKHKEIFTQLSVYYDALYAKHQDTKAIETKLRCEKESLNEDNERITEQLQFLKHKEQNLSVEVEKTEKDKKRIKLQLSDTKTEVNDVNNEITKLQCSLYGKEESISGFRKQLEECRREYDRSRNSVLRLECDMKRTSEEMTNVKACTVRTEQKLTLERDTLSNEMECKRRKLCELQTTLDEQKHALSEQKSSVSKLELRVRDLTSVHERDRRNTVDQIRKLTEEIYGYREEIVRKNGQLEKLQSINECKTLDMGDKTRQVNTLNCAVDEMGCAIEKVEQSLRNNEQKLESSQQEFECKMKSKCTKMAELDQEACELRKKVEDQTTSVCGMQKLTPVDSCPCPSKPCDNINNLIAKYSSNKRNTACNVGCGSGSNNREKLVCENQGLNSQLASLKRSVMTCGQN